MEHDVVGDESRPDAAIHHAPEHVDRVPEPARTGECGHERRVRAGVGRRRGLEESGGLGEAAGAREHTDDGGEHARLVEGAVTVKVPRRADRGERDAGVPTARGERVHDGSEVVLGKSGEDVARGGVFRRVSEEREERAASGDGEGRRQVPRLVVAAGPAPGGVERAAEARLARGGGRGGAGGGEEGGRGEEARRGGGGRVMLALGDDGVGDSRARRRSRSAEGERKGDHFGHGAAGGNRRGLGVKNLRPERRWHRRGRSWRRRRRLDG